MVSPCSTGRCASNGSDVGRVFRAAGRTEHGDVDDAAGAPAALLTTMVDWRSHAASLVKRAALALAALLSLLIVVEDVRVLVYGLSHAYHAVNLAAFVFRRTDAVRFALLSVACRTLAFGVLAAVAVRSGELAPSVGGWSLLVAGIVLNALAVRALGVTRTYYGVELGAVPHARVTSFPYSWFSHPMQTGIVLQFVAIGLLCPALSREFPLLVPGHVALTVLTAVVEHFDLHVAPRRFRS